MDATHREDTCQGAQHVERTLHARRAESAQTVMGGRARLTRQSAGRIVAARIAPVRALATAAMSAAAAKSAAAAAAAKTVATVATASALVLAAAAPANAVGLGLSSGVDVSGYQHPQGAGIDWNGVRTAGQSFAFVKASEGTGWVNEHFSTDIAAADLAGLEVGSYHYARPAKDPRQQAAHFAAQLEGVNSSLPPVLDLEVAEGKNPQELAQWTRDFLNEFEAITGTQPMIYTYKYFWKEQMGDTAEFSNYPLWLAAYQNRAPEPVGGWDELTFWQRSDAGRIGGITGPVDMNLFNGDDAQLARFSAGDRGAAGGKLSGYTVPGGSDLGGDASVIAQVILALGDSPEVLAAAESAGLAPGEAQVLLDHIGALERADALPKPELEKLAAGDYTLGDLAILLDNAEHVSGIGEGGDAGSETTGEPSGDPAGKAGVPGVPGVTGADLRALAGLLAQIS